MLSAIDAPKSKSITIAFFSLKLMIIGFMFVKQVQQSGESGCVGELSQLITLYNIFFLAAMIFDAFLLFYFYVTTKFGRLQYYVFFIFHLIFTIFAIIVTLSEISNKSLCTIKPQFLGTCLFINIIFLTMSVVLMYSNLYLGLKLVHTGCNIIWVFIWLTDQQLSYYLFTIVAIIHTLLSIANLLSIIIINFQKKTASSAICWKYLYLLSVVMMILSYILMFVGRTVVSSVFGEVYAKIGWIQIIPPVLLLMFLHTQYGDPRQKILRKDAKVFLKARQNQGFIEVDDAI